MKMIQDCESLAIDYDWSLTRKSACHIANQNQEMGELRNSQVEFSYRLHTIETYITINTWVWGVMTATVLAIAVKKIFSTPINKE